MVFANVYAVWNIGVKQLREAIAAKFSNKDVWVMDSDELRREIVIERLARNHGTPQSIPDAYQDDRNILLEIIRHKRSTFKHCVYINYMEDADHIESGDFECMMAMRYDEQAFRRCYLDMCQDRVDIHVSAMKKMLSRTDTDAVDTVMWWGEVFGYDSFRPYESYKRRYMLFLKWVYQFLPVSIMDVDDTISTIMELLTGIQRVLPPSKERYPRTNNILNQFLRSSPLVDLQWYKDNLGIDPEREGATRQRRQKLLRKRRHDRKKRSKHRHDKSNKRHRHGSKSRKRHDKSKKRPKSNRHKRRH